jgi:hypothetical protein
VAAYFLQMFNYTAGEESYTIQKAERLNFGASQNYCNNENTLFLLRKITYKNQILRNTGMYFARFDIPRKYIRRFNSSGYYAA